MNESDKILIVKIREKCLMCDMTLQRLDELNVKYRTELTNEVAPILIMNGKILHTPFNTTKLKNFLKEVDAI